MATKKPNNNGKKKVVRINLTWLYFLIIIVLGFIVFSHGGSNPQKIEWPEVQEMIQNGDVEKIEFVRNDYQGNIMSMVTVTGMWRTWMTSGTCTGRRSVTF